jgi:hypothetical protein
MLSNIDSNPKMTMIEVKNSACSYYDDEDRGSIAFVDCSRDRTASLCAHATAYTGCAFATSARQLLI